MNRCRSGRDGYSPCQCQRCLRWQSYFLIYGEMSGIERDLLNNLVCAGDVVIEVGAYIGRDTVALAESSPDQRETHAFEPERAVILCSKHRSVSNEPKYYAYRRGVGRTRANYGHLKLIIAVGNFLVALYFPIAKPQKFKEVEPLCSDGTLGETPDVH